MKEITLIGTIHKENGAATSFTLCDILKRISPEVIFLEVSNNDFIHFCRKRDRQNLESIAVAHYVSFSKVELVPVDQIIADEISFIAEKRKRGKAEKGSGKGVGAL